METKNSFRDHLNRSSDIVRDWPSWKQNVVDHARPKSAGVDGRNGSSLPAPAPAPKAKVPRPG